jgi:hypothetical protein
VGMNPEEIIVLVNKDGNWDSLKWFGVKEFRF